MSSKLDYRPRRPDCPIVDLAFYFADRTGADALREVVLHLLGHGALFTGDVGVFRGEGLRARPFAHAQVGHERRRLAHDNELRQALDDPDTSVREVELVDAVGAVPRTIERAVQVTSRVESVSHPVALLSEGCAFSWPGAERRMRTHWRRLRRRFLELIDELAPTYAGFTVLEWLRTPEELVLPDGDRTACFEDVYMSESYLGPEGLRAMTELAGDLIPVTRTRDGLFVSCLDGEGSVPNEAGWGFSKGVAQLIARRHRRDQWKTASWARP